MKMNKLRDENNLINNDSARNEYQRIGWYIITFMKGN